MNEKKLLLIKSALKLFYAKGINSVGINEILIESKVAKKTLYRYFTGKEELVLATLNYRDDIFCQWFHTILSSKQVGTESIIALFYGLDAWFNNRVPELGHFKGCFFINTAAEYGNSDAIPRHFCKQHKNKIRVLLNEKIKLFIKETDKCELITEAIILLKEGAIVSASVEGRLDAALKCLPIIRRLLNL